MPVKVASMWVQDQIMSIPYATYTIRLHNLEFGVGSVITLPYRWFRRLFGLTEYEAHCLGSNPRFHKETDARLWVEQRARFYLGKNENYEVEIAAAFENGNRSST